MRGAIGEGFIGVAILALTAGCSTFAAAQVVTYSLGEHVPLLDDAFYQGDLSAGSDVGRPAVYNVGVNHAETQALVLGVDRETLTQQLYIVDLADSSSWRSVEDGLDSFVWTSIEWSLDDSIAYLNQRSKYDAATNSLVRDFDFGTGSASNVPFLTTHSITRQQDSNFLLTRFQNDIVMLPMSENGNLVTTPPAARRLTQFGLDSNTSPLDFLNVRGDGSAVLFSVHNLADRCDTYILNDVASILGQDSPVPTTLDDPRIHPLRTPTTPKFDAVATFSRDGSVVLTSRDFNDVFTIQSFFDSGVLADFDIVVVLPEGTAEQRLAAPQNQSNIQLVPCSGRFTVIHGENNTGRSRAFLTTLVACNDLGANVEASGVSEWRVTKPVIAKDASGTKLSIRASRTFRSAGLDEPIICISTPVRPVPADELPTEARSIFSVRSFVSSIPVTRRFEPLDGTFNRNTRITIEYTDCEVGDVEHLLTAFRFDEQTGRFQLLPARFRSTVSVDTAANTVSFETDRLGIYGVGYLSEIENRFLSVRILLTALLTAAILAGIAAFIRNKARRLRG